MAILRVAGCVLFGLQKSSQCRAMVAGAIEVQFKIQNCCVGGERKLLQLIWAET